MSTQKVSQAALEDLNVGLRPKLAALWSAFMFLYIYVDYFHLYMPGALNQIIAGKVFVFELTQAFLLTALVSITIPALMIVFSIVLPAKANRYTNLIVGALYIPYSLFNLAGEAWIHMVLAAIIEVALLCMIIYYAWKWPRVVA